MKEYSKDKEQPATHAMEWLEEGVGRQEKPCPSTCRCTFISYNTWMLFFTLQVLKWVEETVQAMKVHLLSSNHDAAQENKWDVPFDPSLREVTVSLSGPAPQIELSDPFGKPIIDTFYSVWHFCSSQEKL